MSEEVCFTTNVLVDVTNNMQTYDVNTASVSEPVVVDDTDEVLDHVENCQLEDEDMLENGTMEQVISSQAFRDELHEMVAQQITAQNQTLNDLVALRQRYRREPVANVNGSVIPVADIRGVDTLNYSKGEKLFRCKLASCYRLTELFGWSDEIASGTITAQLDEDCSDQLLVAPHGLLCDEVTASSLVKVKSTGEVLDPGSSGLEVDQRSLALHTALYSALKRTDIKCILHLTASKAVAVSAMKSGLLPLCPEAVAIGEVNYFDYCGSILDSEDRENLAEALGPTSKVLFLRHYGAVVCGGSIEESYLLAFNLMSAIEAQLTLAAYGLDNIYIPSEEMQRAVYENGFRPPSGATGIKRRWRRGELEFEAMMRQLDLAGYQTGYSYHMSPSSRSQGRTERSSSVADVSAGLGHSSSFGGSDRELARFGSPLKTARLSVDRQMTPNIYQQIVEKGSEARKITKWVPLDVTCPSPVPKSPVPPNKVAEKPNQFAPQGINPAELKEKVKAIRKDYYTDKVTAGPQSRILEGINWDEAQAIKDGTLSDSVSSPTPTVPTVPGVVSASKAVIQREHQRSATVVSKTLFYPPNPFNRMSEDDIEEYKSSVDRRSRSASVEPPSDERQTSSRQVSVEQSSKTDEVKVQEFYGGGDAPCGPSEQAQFNTDQ